MGASCQADDGEDQSPQRRRRPLLPPNPEPLPALPDPSEDEASGDEGEAWPLGELMRPGGNANRGATVSAAQTVCWPRDAMPTTEPGHVWICDRCSLPSGMLKNASNV